MGSRGRGMRMRSREAGCWWACEIEGMDLLRVAKGQSTHLNLTRRDAELRCCCFAELC